MFWFVISIEDRDIFFSDVKLVQGVWNVCCLLFINLNHHSNLLRIYDPHSPQGQGLTEQMGVLGQHSVVPGILKCGRWDTVTGVGVRPWFVSSESTCSGKSGQSGVPQSSRYSAGREDGVWPWRLPCGAGCLTQVCSTQVFFNARDRRVGVLLGGCLLAGFAITCLVISQFVFIYCLAYTKLRLRLWTQLQVQNWVFCMQCG